MKKVAHTAPTNAAATVFGGNGKQPSPPSKIVYVSSFTLGLVFIGAALIQGQAVPALIGYGFLGLAVLLEPRIEAKHPIAELARLRSVIVPVVTDQDGATLIGVTRVYKAGELFKEAIGVTRVYKAGELFEETNWKAEALEREALLEHYQLMGLPARGTS
jgi:hypothetical protein